MSIAAQQRMTAFMDNPDAPRPGNPIHSTGGAKAYGYEGALVGGASVYGWAVRTIVEALGEVWLDEGWAEVQFRRPVYPGDELDISVADDGVFNIAKGDQVCIRGEVGLGEANWLVDLAMPTRLKPDPRADELPALTMENAPVDRDLKARAVPTPVDEIVAFAREKEGETLEYFLSQRPRLHPGWIASQLTHLLHHSYDYGPAIHAASHMQHLRPAYAGQTLTVAGHCVEVYERKGHHYIVNDGAILGEEGEILVRIRHTAIFRVAKRG
ncbi:MAG: MaoC/PaaZ C-terminal domain-containing protein [Gammaproteobacteria bacterium]|nr:MaoC/PaaZ C-terminal domain-containing protein [Gammaproteobacteria bacterium]